MQGDDLLADYRISRRDIIRLAIWAGAVGGLSLPGLMQVAVAQTTQPATKPSGTQSRTFDFQLDKVVRLEGRVLTNANGERWIELWNAKFRSSKVGELNGVLCYIPYYKSGIVSVLAIDFVDAEGKTVAQAKMDCPSKTGLYHWGLPDDVAISIAVEFQVRYAPDQQIAKFRLSLVEEAKKQEKNAAADAKR
ncbi:MAG TPA: hypothetical protein VHP11_04875 [Tepidisphaeraceae bacterium]|nr:hypothetical protein [Tepidisphaeraceae bacterium]